MLDAAPEVPVPNEDDAGSTAALILDGNTRVPGRGAAGSATPTGVSPIPRGRGLATHASGRGAEAGLR